MQLAWKIRRQVDKVEVAFSGESLTRTDSVQCYRGSEE